MKILNVILHKLYFKYVAIFQSAIFVLFQIDFNNISQKYYVEKLSSMHSIERRLLHSIHDDFSEKGYLQFDFALR